MILSCSPSVGPAAAQRGLAFLMSLKTLQVGLNCMVVVFVKVASLIGQVVFNPFVFVNKILHIPVFCLAQPLVFCLALTCPRTSLM